MMSVLRGQTLTLPRSNHLNLLLLHSTPSDQSRSLRVCRWPARLTLIVISRLILAVRLGYLSLPPAPSRLFVHLDVGHGLDGLLSRIPCVFECIGSVGIAGGLYHHASNRRPRSTLDPSRSRQPLDFISNASKRVGNANKVAAIMSSERRGWQDSTRQAVTC